MLSPSSMVEATILTSSALPACERNWAKRPNLAGIIGGKLYPLFNPRKQRWKRHFRWDNIGAQAALEAFRCPTSTSARTPKSRG
jgi:hypothetical protein